MKTKSALLKIRILSTVDRSDRFWLSLGGTQLVTNSSTSYLPLSDNDNTLYNDILDIIETIAVEGYALSDRYADKCEVINNFIEIEMEGIADQILDSAKRVRDHGHLSSQCFFEDGKYSRILFTLENFNVITAFAVA